VPAVDAKINFDDNAAYVTLTGKGCATLTPRMPAEMEAKASDLSFVKLDGNIGWSSMALDSRWRPWICQALRCEPANFLDIGGSSNPQKVITAMSIIMRDKSVKSILFNIFGGITRCDDVAKGIVQAVNQLKPKVPIVVRLTRHQ